jgi:hypothetical protein
VKQFTAAAQWPGSWWILQAALAAFNCRGCRAKASHEMLLGVVEGRPALDPLRHVLPRANETTQPRVTALVSGFYPRTFVLAGILLLTLLGLGLRFYRISNQSLWTDEISSIETARASLSQIIEESAIRNNSLPTYFLLLRAILREGNQNIELRARGLSALAGCLSIPLFVGIVYLWRRHWGVALLAGLLLATNPLHIWYSQEVRAYATMLFFGLLAVLSYELARSSGKPLWWLVYVPSAIVAMALHKTALVFPVFCGLWHTGELMRGRGRIRDLRPHAAVLVFALFVIGLKAYPPAPAFGRQSSILEIVYTGMTFVGGYSFGPSLTDIQWYGAMGGVSRNLLQVGVLSGVLVSVALACALRFRSVVFGKEATLMVLSIGIVAATAPVSGFPYNVRYVLPALFGFLALVAALFVIMRKSWHAGLLVGTVLLVGWWADGQWFHSTSYRKGDSRAVARWLVGNQKDVQSWTVLPGYLSASIEWYLQAHPEVVSRLQPAKESQTTFLPPVPDVLIIGRRHHVFEPDKLIASYKSIAGRVQTNLSISGFELYVREAENERK